MKKLIFAATALLTLAACSSTPDGIDEDAPAPYAPAPRTLMCNTTRALGVCAFSAANDCLYYEVDNVDDKNAAGFYQRVSETQAHVIIRSDDTYEVEYILSFVNNNEGKVEEKFTQNDATTTYQGSFTLR
ncbi:MAG: lipoprotein [Akkermansia sp.]|nr:lipoprotein [Akkermansia sp.]